MCLRLNTECYQHLSSQKRVASQNWMMIRSKFKLLILTNHLTVYIVVVKVIQ